MTTLFGARAATIEKLKAGAYHGVNTYDGKVLTKFKELADRQLATAIRIASTGFESWRRTTFAGRSVAAAKAAALRSARLASTWPAADLAFGGPRHSGFGRVRSYLGL